MGEEIVPSRSNSSSSRESAIAAIRTKVLGSLNPARHASHARGLQTLHEERCHALCCGQGTSFEDAEACARHRAARSTHGLLSLDAARVLVHRGTKSVSKSADTETSKTGEQKEGRKQKEGGERELVWSADAGILPECLGGRRVPPSKAVLKAIAAHIRCPQARVLVLQHARVLRGELIKPVSKAAKTPATHQTLQTLPPWRAAAAHLLLDRTPALRIGRFAVSWVLVAGAGLAAAAVADEVARGKGRMAREPAAALGRLGITDEGLVCEEGAVPSPKTSEQMLAAVQKTSESVSAMSRPRIQELRRNTQHMLTGAAMTHDQLRDAAHALRSGDFRAASSSVRALCEEEGPSALTLRGDARGSPPLNQGQQAAAAAAGSYILGHMSCGVQELVKTRGFMAAVLSLPWALLFRAGQRARRVELLLLHEGGHHVHLAKPESVLVVLRPWLACTEQE